MNTDHKKAALLRQILDESRNGANFMVQHALVRSFSYSDGVKEVAEAVGAYWFLDIVATEFAPAYFLEYREGRVGNGLITIKVDDEQRARISLSLDDDQPDFKVRNVQSTDFPIGVWTFMLGSDGEDGVSMILVSEY